MKNKILMILAIVVSFLFSQVSWSNQCDAPKESESIVVRDDFPWGQSLSEISALADKIYQSGRRLSDRAYVKGDQLRLPIPKLKAEAWGFKFSHFKIDNSLIEKLKTHFKKIYESNFGSELIYSDVGHTHVFASKEESKKFKAEGLTSDSAEYYERVLHSKNTKFLYHTAEQLGAPQTQEEEWRKTHRTVVGNADGSIYELPFTKSLEGYSQFFSIYFNASSTGCFTFNGLHFDISLSSPE